MACGPADGGCKTAAHNSQPVGGGVGGRGVVQAWKAAVGLDVGHNAEPAGKPILTNHERAQAPTDGCTTDGRPPRALVPRASDRNQCRSRGGFSAALWAAAPHWPESWVGAAAAAPPQQQGRCQVVGSRSSRGGGRWLAAPAPAPWKTLGSDHPPLPPMGTAGRPGSSSPWGRLGTSESAWHGGERMRAWVRGWAMASVEQSMASLRD